MIERRKHKRVKIVQVVKGSVRDNPTEIIDGRIINISAGGICILSEKTFPAETIVHLNFKLRDDLKFEYLSGIINRINTPHEHYMAISFSGLNDKEIKKLNSFISSIKFLRSIKQLKDLTDNEIQLVADIGNEEHFVEDQYIFHEGMEGNAFYIVLSGSVRIVKETATAKPEVLAIIREGEYFGEMALLDDYSRSASAIAHRDTALFTVPKKRFRELMDSNKESANKMLWVFVKTLSSRLREADKKMSDSFLMFKNSGIDI